MKLGLNSEAFLDWPLERILSWVTLSAPKVTHLELVAGGFCGTGHCDVELLLQDTDGRRRLQDQFARHDLRLAALNVSGNPLHPNPEIARRFDAELRNAIRLAPQLGINRIIAMSGCPGAGPGDRVAPHFSGGAWLPDYAGVLEWQWGERLLPYWSEISRMAAQEHPSLLICLELHPGTAVHNTANFLRLAQVGANIAANIDPSHFFWQSINPQAVVRKLGSRIGHAHGKDTVLRPENVAVNGVLDSRWPGHPEEMPWSFATVGHGHDLGWWRAFVTTLADTGFDGVIAIEHEDPGVPAEPGVLASVELLDRALQALEPV